MALLDIPPDRRAEGGGTVAGRMIAAYEGQRLTGSVLDALVAQTVRQEMEAQAEARRREEAEQAEALAYSRRRCNELRADLMERTDAYYSPTIDRRWSPLDYAWGLYGLVILAAGAVKDAAMLFSNAAAAGKAKAMGYRNNGRRKARRRKKYAARQRETDRALRRST